MEIGPSGLYNSKAPDQPANPQYPNWSFSVHLYSNTFVEATYNKSSLTRIQHLLLNYRLLIRTRF